MINSLTPYPFDVSIDAARNAFRFINLSCKPMVTNGREAESLLIDLANIVQNNMMCLGDENHRYSLSEKEIIRIIQNKTVEIVSAFQNLSFSENFKSFFFNHSSKIECLNDKINIFAAEKIGIWSVTDVFLNVIVGHYLDVCSTSRLMRTCQKMQSVNITSFKKKFKQLKPVLKQKLIERVERERRTQAQLKFEQERSQRAFDEAWPVGLG